MKQEIEEVAYEETTCQHCSMKGQDADGGQLHWGDCPELKDPYAEGDRLADEERDNNL